MNYAKVLNSIPERWHHEFVHFISSGDASEEFLAVLDSDPKLQELVELALTAQLNNFKKTLKRRGEIRASPSVVTAREHS